MVNFDDDDDFDGDDDDDDDDNDDHDGDDHDDDDDDDDHDDGDDDDDDAVNFPLDGLHCGWSTVQPIWQIVIIIFSMTIQFEIRIYTQRERHERKSIQKESISSTGLEQISLIPERGPAANYMKKFDFPHHKMHVISN